MNITFLIGNGFDINAGLRTQYRQFLKFYRSPKCGHEYAAEIGGARGLDIVSQFTGRMQDLEYWSNFESVLGRETVNPPLDSQEGFDICLADFEYEFNEYLKGELARFDLEEGLLRATTSFQEDLTDHMDRLRANFKNTLRDGFGDKLRQDRLYQFISFNYTPVLDLLLARLRNVSYTETATSVNHKFGKVIHVHGKIGDGMIMGVNDSSQIGNMSLAARSEFHSSIVKPVVNREFGSGADSEAEYLIDSSDEICIFGMSIGETDACWWRRIGGWLLADKSRQVILFGRGQNLFPLHPQFFPRQEAALKNRFLAQCFPHNDAARRNTAPQVFAALQSGMFSGVTLREKAL